MVKYLFRVQVAQVRFLEEPINFLNFSSEIYFCECGGCVDAEEFMKNGNDDVLCKQCLEDDKVLMKASDVLGKRENK